MKALVLDRYGAPAQVLSLQEVDRPAPGSQEVLVRVRGGRRSGRAAMGRSPAILR